MVFLNAGWTDGLSHGARDSFQLRHKVLEVDATKAGGRRNATPFWGSLPSGNREEDDLATTHSHTHIYRFSLDMFLFCFVLFVRSFVRFIDFCAFLCIYLFIIYLSILHISSKSISSVDIYVIICVLSIPVFHTVFRIPGAPKEPWRGGPNDTVDGST